jgi:hypothetical protein
MYRELYDQLLQTLDVLEQNKTIAHILSQLRQLDHHSECPLCRSLVDKTVVQDELRFFEKELARDSTRSYCHG